jgi:hypothetical protein
VARAVLTPLVAVEELVRRNALRAPDEQVPNDVLERQAHCRSLLSADLLLEEGFASVHELQGLADNPLEHLLRVGA